MQAYPQGQKADWGVPREGPREASQRDTWKFAGREGNVHIPMMVTVSQVQARVSLCQIVHFECAQLAVCQSHLHKLFKIRTRR